MKDATWDNQLLADYRAFIRSDSARQAFDVLVAAAIKLPTYHCRPNDAKGPKKAFVYEDALSGERPFAFIVNREHLLFYVRKEGIRLVAGGLSALQKAVPSAAKNNDGEWTVRIETTNEAMRLQALLFGAVDKGGVRRKAGGAELQRWRAAPESAREVLDTIFAKTPADTRQQWEEFLADSIQYAAARYPDRWALALHRSYLRFIVGMVLCIQFHPKHGVTALLLRTTAPRGLKLLGHEYKHAPGCEEALIPFAGAEGIISRIREANRSAIGICATAHAGNGVFRRAHSPGVLRYLEQVLGRTLPNPSYAVDPATEPHRPASEPVDDAVEEAIHQRTDIGLTEKARLVNARRGQGVYRANLEQIEKRCRVTGISDGRHLRASHIKPWSKSDDREKLDGYNGLLLSPNVDHLFDGGYISFEDNGDLLVSQNVRDDILTALGLRRDANVGAFRAEQCKYLEWHRTNYGFTKLVWTKS